MANKVQVKAPTGDKCFGGNSFGCNRSEHEKSKRDPDIYCMNCKQRMGCLLCAQHARDLLCLRCRDWATLRALQVHGHIVSAESQYAKDSAKIIVSAGKVSRSDYLDKFIDMDRQYPQVGWSEEGQDLETWWATEKQRHAKAEEFFAKRR